MLDSSNSCRSLLECALLFLPIAKISLIIERMISFALPSSSDAWCNLEFTSQKTSSVLLLLFVIAIIPSLTILLSLWLAHTRNGKSNTGRIYETLFPFCRFPNIHHAAGEDYEELAKDGYADDGNDERSVGWYKAVGEFDNASHDLQFASHHNRIFLLLQLILHLCKRFFRDCPFVLSFSLSSPLWQASHRKTTLLLDMTEQKQLEFRFINLYQRAYS